ncbi:hypothetical protein CPC08DRAFT_769898 [Agrocybe pediades]|nr:hypothetical protein CPC08DRAFT_769898 [Agrocybe pediades]
MEGHTPLEHEVQLEAACLDTIGNAHGSTRNPPILPPELHELIVHQLKDEKWALKRCTYTCRLHWYLARKILLKRMAFKFYKDSTPTDEFLEVLQASPEIVDYVERLTIRENTYYHFRSTQDYKRDDSLSRVIQALTNVVHLVLRDLDNFWQWKPSLVLTVMAKCDSLRSLTLLRINDLPLKIFDHLQNLESINLVHVHFHDNDPAVRAAQASPASPYRIKNMKLVDAYIKYGIPIHSFLVQRQFGVGHLETLTINMFTTKTPGRSAEEDCEHAKLLVRAHANTLKVLKFALSSKAPVRFLENSEPVFDVSTMPLLESLSLAGVVCNPECYMESGSVGLRFLSSHLETFPTLAGRTFKSITLSAAIYDVGYVMDYHLDFEALKHFETLIVERILHQTESLCIEFMISELEEPDRRRGGIKQLKRRLPTLHALNLLKFTDEFESSGFASDIESFWWL